MRVALVQLNPTVGDLDGNTHLITQGVAQNAQADLIVFSELCVCGYPPRDLLLRERFVEKCERTAAKIGASVAGPSTVVLGTPFVREDGRFANGLIAYREGREIARYAKRLLPTYDVFDEDRYFVAGTRPAVIDVDGIPVGLSICEDVWRGNDAGYAGRYAGVPDPVDELVRAGARVIVNASASPFVLGKWDKHTEILSEHAAKHRVPVLAVNQVGANDDLIFAGRSAAVDATGALVGRAVAFENDALIVEIGTDRRVTAETELVEVSDEKAVWNALVLGVRDYFTKTGSRPSAIIGLSGGIDSALTAAVAARALAPENVLGVRMPGKYSSQHSLDDAADLAVRLGVELITVPIEAPFAGFGGVIDTAFDEIGTRRLSADLPDLTEENLQSRVRGTIVMTLSNRTGALVLTTGNKSEAAVGYCTLYGDMNGGLAVLSDVPKMLVYRLSRWLNEHPNEAGFDRPPIPESTIEKPPSAELAPDQKDEDSLPDYPTLDRLIELYVDERRSVDAVVEAMSDRLSADESRRICALIDRNEYKRWQAAVGLKVTRVAFGPGRRMPIARR
ncbi:MAG: NAD+ synthase [Planctomycetota bacterium]